MKIKKLKYRFEPENYNKDELTKLVDESIIAFNNIMPYFMLVGGNNLIDKLSADLFINIANFIMNYDDYQDLAELLKEDFDIELED